MFQVNKIRYGTYNLQWLRPYFRYQLELMVWITKMVPYPHKLKRFSDSDLYQFAFFDSTSQHNIPTFYVFKCLVEWI